MCLLKNDPGPCGNYEPVWYFEPVTGVCRRFLYGGCGGNANRFDTAEACWDRCGDSPYHSSTLTPRPTSTHKHDQPHSECFYVLNPCHSCCARRLFVHFRKFRSEWSVGRCTAIDLSVSHDIWRVEWYVCDWSSCLSTSSSTAVSGHVLFSTRLLRSASPTYLLKNRSQLRLKLKLTR